MITCYSRSPFHEFSLTFPRPLSRLFSHSEAPFWPPRNLSRFSLLASDYPLYFMSVGQSMRNSYKRIFPSHHWLSKQQLSYSERILVQARIGDGYLPSLTTSRIADCSLLQLSVSRKPTVIDPDDMSSFRIGTQFQPTSILTKGVHQCHRVEEFYDSNRCSQPKN